MSGHFAVIMHWATEHGGFWEPWSTGSGRYATQAEAAEEAKALAECEELEYRPAPPDDTVISRPGTAANLVALADQLGAEIHYLGEKE